MTDAREIIAQTFRRSHRDTCYPDASTGECEIVASAIVADLEAAGIRILGKDEVDLVTVEKCAAIAERLSETWSNSRDAYQAVQEAAASDKANEIAAAIRTIGRKA